MNRAASIILCIAALLVAGACVWGGAWFAVEWSAGQDTARLELNQPGDQ